MSFLVHQVRKPLSSSPSPPLLLLLHGVGSHEGDLLGLAQHLDPRFYVVSLRAPRDYAYGGYSWFDLTWTERGVSGDPVQAQESLQVLRQFIQELRQWDPGLNKAPLYVLGFSQGGIMALLLAFEEALAGAVVMSSCWPEGLQVDPGTVRAGLPMLVVHGRQDQVLPLAQGRRIRQELRGLPVKLTYEEYNMGHEVSPDSLFKVRQWLSKQLNDPS